MEDNFRIIKYIIDEWDPIGLFPAAPDDEYNIEIKKIVKSIEAMNCINSNKLAAEIKNIFSLTFEECFRKEYVDCIKISEKILQQINR